MAEDETDLKPVDEGEQVIGEVVSESDVPVCNAEAKPYSWGELSVKLVFGRSKTTHAPTQWH